MPYKDQTSEEARRAKVKASTAWRERNRERDRENSRKRREKNKQILIEHLGGKCVGCGTTEDLQFDHIVRADKSFTIGQALAKSIDKLIPEAEKCQLLCKTCHTLKGVCYNDYHQLAEQAVVDVVFNQGLPAVSEIRR